MHSYNILFGILSQIPVRTSPSQLFIDDLEDFGREEQFFYTMKEGPIDSAKNEVLVKTPEGSSWSQWFNDLVWGPETETVYETDMNDSVGYVDLPVPSKNRKEKPPMSQRVKGGWVAIIFCAILIVVLIGVCVIAVLYFQHHPDLNHPSGRTSPLVDITITPLKKIMNKKGKKE